MTRENGSACFMPVVEAGTLTIRDWPLSERPRERLLAKGAGSLSTAELIAIILGTGTGGENAVDVAKRLLAGHNGDIVGLFASGCGELTSVRGIGKAKAVRLSACFELSHRIARGSAGARPVVNNAADVASFFGQRLKVLPSEHVVTLFLDRKNRVMGEETVAIGAAEGASFHLKELLRRSITSGAASIVLVHNHPSGDPAPSPQDVALTKRIAKAAKLVGISVLDHVIVARDGFRSLRDEGVL